MPLCIPCCWLHRFLFVALAVLCWLVSLDGSQNPWEERSRFISLAPIILTIKSMFRLCLLIDKVSA